MVVCANARNSRSNPFCRCSLPAAKTYLRPPGSVPRRGSDSPTSTGLWMTEIFARDKPIRISARLTPSDGATTRSGSRYSTGINILQ